jgi:hypothetical protein
MSSPANSGGRLRTSTPSVAQSRCQRGFRPDLAQFRWKRSGNRHSREPPGLCFLQRPGRPITLPSHHRPVSHLCYRSLIEFTTGVLLTRFGSGHFRAGRLNHWLACARRSAAGCAAVTGTPRSALPGSPAGLRGRVSARKLAATDGLPPSASRPGAVGWLDTDRQARYDRGLPSFQKHPQGTVRCVRLRRVRTRSRDSGM